MFAFWGLKLFQWFVGRLPIRSARCLGRFLGTVAFYFFSRHRKIALRNLRLAFGPEREKTDLRRIARGSFAQLGFNAVEFLRVSRFIQPGWEKCFRVTGGDRVRKAFRKRRGVIFVLAHFGNWEYAAFLSRLLDFRAAAVGQDIKNPAVDGLVKDTRETIGLELLPKFEVVSSISSYLKGNRAVAIFADQRARKMNVTVNFFGRPADTTAAPAVMAIKSRAPLLPAFVYYADNGVYDIVIGEEIEIPSGLSMKRKVREVMQKVTEVFEDKIGENPELWLWGHRRWGDGES